MNLKEKLETLPNRPGVYLFKNHDGKIVYIGKGKSLRNRVRSYFQESRNFDLKTDRLVQEIVDLECIVTDNEIESLILESNLVKKNKPIYNALLKDDKSFPYIKLTVNEPYPRAYITRRIEKDGGLYYGPFLPASLAKETLKLIEKYFLIRNCNIRIDGKLDRPCLDYYIKRCAGPCVAGLCTKEEYGLAVKDVRLFLEGRSEDLEKSIEQKMNAASQRENFELAAYYRDSLARIKALGEKQKMIMHSMTDADIFGYHQEANLVSLQVFSMRGSRIVGRREFYWEGLLRFDPAEFISATLRQYYLNDSYVPGEIHIPTDFEDRELIEEWLSQTKGYRVKIIHPKRGEKRRLLELVEKNARLAFENRFRIIKPKNEPLLKELQAALSIPTLPKRIEGFDISNIQGTDSVASMVVFENAESKKNEYRKFRIKTVAGADDFASVYEVVYRRYRRLLDENKAIPDLILIDGGVGQLHAAARALEELGLNTQPLASIAKKEEIIYVRGQEDHPIALDKTAPVLHLVQRIRDEAHRFAVSYHTRRRAIRDFTSELLEVPGISNKRKTKLLRAFGSLDKVKRARLEELAVHVGPKQAKKLIEYFSKDQLGQPGERLS